jgi:hypothetical protein
MPDFPPRNHASIENATDAQRAAIERRARPKRKAARVTARKYNGDDAYSWAVFVDGCPKWTGLQRSEVDYYKRIENERLASK